MYDLIQRAENILFNKKTMDDQTQVIQAPTQPVAQAPVETPIEAPVAPIVNPALNCTNCQGQGLIDNNTTRCPNCLGTGNAQNGTQAFPDGTTIIRADGTFLVQNGVEVKQ